MSEGSRVVTTCCGLFGGGSGGTPCGTGHLDCANSGRGWCQQRDVVILEVSYEDALAQAEGRYVNDDLVGKVLHRGADAYFTLAEDQFTALLYTFRVAGQAHRNVDRDRFAGNYVVEVDVQYVIFDGMVLHFAHYAYLFLAFDVELHQVGLRRIDQRVLPLWRPPRSETRFATAVDRAGNHPLFADVFALFFAEISAFHAGNFDCFHSLKVV